VDRPGDRPFDRPLGPSSSPASSFGPQVPPAGTPPSPPPEPTGRLVSPGTLLSPHARVQAVDTFTSWRRTWRQALNVEGARARTIRVSVAVRYVWYLLVVLGVTAVISTLFADSRYSMAGVLVLFASTTILFTGAVGTMFMPHQRPELVEEVRHYLFQLMLFPALAVAVLVQVIHSYTQDPQRSDGFFDLLAWSLPIMFMVTVVLPPIIFVKAVAGRRHLERSQRDDEEAMAGWSRQDWHQR
jgi:hypothetical protein